MISVIAWKWGNRFSSKYVNVLRSMLSRHLHVDHQVYCPTDDSSGLDPEIIPLPITQFTDTIRCRRRMVQFSGGFGVGLRYSRMLCIDLDVVIVDDITSLVVRPEPLVCWKVGYANVYSGSFVLVESGHLHGLYESYASEPENFPKATKEKNASDQAMLNFYLRGYRVPHWTDKDGFVTYFGDGYEKFEHFGVGPNRTELPPGAKIVVLGSADKHVMDEGAYGWIRDHWK